LTLEDVTKRRSTKFSDDGAINAGEEAEQVDQLRELRRSECGVRLMLTLTTPPCVPFLILPPPKPLESWASPAIWAVAGSLRPRPHALVCHADFGSGPGFLEGNRPTTVTAFFIFCFISLQFKFEFEFEFHFNSCKLM
jgi:hypothetical protein